MRTIRALPVLLVRFCLLPLCAVAVLAHGPLHEQLAAMDAAIARSPEDSTLYLKRAGLRTEHGDWETARTDVVTAEKMGAASGHCAYARARIAVAQRKWDEAAGEIAKFHESYAADAEAWRIRAVIQENLGHADAQLQARREALVKADPPLPDDFVALAQALVVAGKTDESRLVLEAGLKRLGMIPVLLDTAIAIEVKAKAWDAALARLDAAVAHFSNPVRWLARKGDIAQEAGRAEVAREARQAALAVMESLPEGRRNVPANAELTRQLRAKLSHTKENP